MLSTLTAGRNGTARARKSEPPVRPNCSRLQPLSPELLAYFAARGISQRTLARNGVLQDPAGAIAFPYRRDGEVVNLKFRTLDKRFWQVGQGPLLLPAGRACAQQPRSQHAAHHARRHGRPHRGPCAHR